MTVTYTTAVKSVRMDAVMDYFANGTLEILAADDTVLAIFGLDVAGGSITNDVWTLVFDNGTVQGESGAGTGKTATKAQVKNSGGTAGLTGLTVSTSGADINLNNTSIASGQNVTLTSATVTHAT